MPGSNPTTKFKVDISELKANITEANRQIKLARSEFKAAASGMEDWAKSSDGLSAKIKELSAVQDAENKKLQSLKEQYALVVAEQGENSKGAQDLAVKINNQTAAVNRVSKQLEGYSGELKEVQKAEELAAQKGIDFNDALDYIKKDAGSVEKSIDELADSFKDAEKAADEAQDGFTVFKGTMATLVADGIKGLISGLATAIEETREYRTELGMLKAAADTTGSSFSNAKKNLEEVTTITNDSGAAVEGLNNLMTAGFDGSALDEITDQLVGASIKWKDTLKFEGLSDGLQETLATGAAVGPFAELLERGGVNLETFNKGLANCSTEAEKQKFIMDQLNKLGLKEVKKSYEENNQSLIESQKSQQAWNNTMAEISTMVEPVFTSLRNTATTVLNFLINNLPTVIGLMKAAAVAVGTYVAYTTAVQIMRGGFMSLSIAQNAVTVAQKAMNLAMKANPIGIVISLIAGLVVAFVTLWNKSDKFREFWINLWEKVKTASKNAINAVTGFFKNLPENVRTHLSNAAQKVVAWGTDLKNKGVAAAKKLGDSVVSGLKSLPGKLKGVGVDLIKGLWNGISDMAGWIKGKIEGFGKTVLNSLKNFFGIKSPSRVMAEQVGKFLPQGLASGVAKYARYAVDAAKTMRDDFVDASGLGNIAMPQVQRAGSAVADVVGGGSNVQNITFNQYNTSPKSLSRLDIYRQTKAQIRTLKGY